MKRPPINRRPIVFQTTKPAATQPVQGLPRSVIKSLNNITK